MPIQEIIARLESRLRRGRSHFGFRLLASGLMRAATVAAGAVLLAIVAGALVRSWPSLYAPIAAGTAVTLVAAILWFVVLPWLRRPDLWDFAQLVESRVREVRSLLVNALELTPVVRGRRNASGETSRELAAALLAQAERRSREVDFHALAPSAIPRGWGRPALVVAAAWALAWIVAPGPLARSGWSLLHPRLAVAQDVQLSVWPGEVTLAPGATLDVGARVRGSDRQPVLVFVPDGGRSTRTQTTMSAGLPPSGEESVRGSTSDPGGSGEVYRGEIQALASPGRYHVEAGAARSPDYRVILSGRATPVSFEIAYRYPAYTRLPSESQSATRADLVALTGTRATVTVSLDRSVDRVSWTLGTPMRRESDRKWVGETVVGSSRPYDLVVESDGHVERSSFRVEAVPDRPPLLSVSAPAGDLDLPAGQRIAIAAGGSDDFGLTDLSLVYERERGGGRVSLARWPAEPKDALVQAEWDLSPLGLLPGQSVAFTLELRDNDRVHGPNVTRSARFVVRFPTLSQVYDRFQEKETSATNELERAAQEARELAKQVEETRREFDQNPRDRRGEASWEKRQAAKELADRQQAIAEKMQSIAEQLEQATRQASEREAFRKELLDKMQEISKLVRELETPELKEAIRRLSESLQQVDPRRLEANLKTLEQAQQELLKGLERTLELLRRVRQEERLEAASRRAEELARREQALQKQLEQARSDEERERSAAAQEQAKRDSEELQKELEQLTRELNETKQQQAAEQTQQSSETLKQEAQPSLAQSAQQMRQGNRQNAGRQAQRAQQAFQQVAQQLQRTAESLSNEADRQLTESVRRSAQDLVNLSQSQEETLRQGGDSRDRAQRQEDLKEGAERVADDLFDMAKRTPFLPPDASKALGQALERLGKSAESFSRGGEEDGEQQGREASSSLNRAVIALRKAEKSMCQGGKQGGERPSQGGQAQMGSLSQQQGQLNQDTQSLTERLTRQERLVAGDQNALEQLAARQEAIRRGIQDVLDQQREGEVLGRLDEAKKDMEEVAKGLRERRLDQNLVDRQNRILSRLLDAQRSVNRREFDERRESRSGEDVERSSPAELPRALVEPRAQAQRDLLRARAERYPPEYRDLVESYLRRLQETP